MEDMPNLSCSICGRNSEDNSELTMLRTKNDIVICSECISKMHEMVNQTIVEDLSTNKSKEESKEEKKVNISNKLLSPKEIKEYLDQYIIGQEKAKKMLSTSIYNHYKMIRLKIKNQDNKEIQELDKSNLMLCGSTGSGKTAMIKRISKILEVPFTVADITSFSQTGYAGRDVETILRDLLQAADGDLEKAEMGIVYIDEIDKISRKSKKVATSADPAHEAVQQGLLKLIEGSIIDVPKNGARLNPSQETIKMNTENILFVMSGAFEGIEDIIKKRLGTDKNKIGFGSKMRSIKEESIEEKNEIISNIKTDDLKEFGMLPEFLGRTPIVCPIETLSEEALIKILTEPKNSLTKQYNILFNADGFDLEFKQEALEKIASIAIERGTGARSLRGVMEETLGDIMYSLPDLDKENGSLILVDVKEIEDSEEKEFDIQQVNINEEKVQEVI